MSVQEAGGGDNFSAEYAFVRGRKESGNRKPSFREGGAKLLVKICPYCDSEMTKPHYCEQCRSFVWKPNVLDIHYNADTRGKGEIDCGYGEVHDRVDHGIDTETGKKHSRGKPVYNAKTGRYENNGKRRRGRPGRSFEDEAARKSGKKKDDICIHEQIYQKMDERLDSDGRGYREIKISGPQDSNRSSYWSTNDVSGSGTRITRSDHEEVFGSGRPKPKKKRNRALVWLAVLILLMILSYIPESCSDAIQGRASSYLELGQNSSSSQEQVPAETWQDASGTTASSSGDAAAAVSSEAPASSSSDTAASVSSEAPASSSNDAASSVSSGASASSSGTDQYALDDSELKNYPNGCTAYDHFDMTKDQAEAIGREWILSTYEGDADTDKLVKITPMEARNNKYSEDSVVLDSSEYLSYDMAELGSYEDYEKYGHYTFFIHYDTVTQKLHNIYAQMTSKAEVQEYLENILVKLDSSVDKDEADKIYSQLIDKSGSDENYTSTEHAAIMILSYSNSNTYMITISARESAN